jgi:hypothetical protein
MHARTVITAAAVLAVVAVGVAAAREVALERKRNAELEQYRAALAAFDRSRLPPPRLRPGYIAASGGLGVLAGAAGCLAGGPALIAGCALLGGASGAASNYFAQRAQGAK